jgi:hypothetical protein
LWLLHGASVIAARLAYVKVIDKGGVQVHVHVKVEG